MCKTLLTYHRKHLLIPVYLSLWLFNNNTGEHWKPLGNAFEKARGRRLMDSVSWPLQCFDFRYMYPHKKTETKALTSGKKCTAREYWRQPRQEAYPGLFEALHWGCLPSHKKKEVWELNKKRSKGISRLLDQRERETSALSIRWSVWTSVKKLRYISPVCM